MLPESPGMLDTCCVQRWSSWEVGSTQPFFDNSYERTNLPYRNQPPLQCATHSTMGHSSRNNHASAARGTPSIDRGSPYAVMLA